MESGADFQDEPSKKLAALGAELLALGGSLDGDIPVLTGDNGKKLRMGLDNGLPQFFLVTPSAKGEWFMRIHPARLPNGMEAGSYEGKYVSKPRMLTIFHQPGGTTKVMLHPPNSTGGRFIIVSTAQFMKAWEYTLQQYNDRQRR
ncbi:MAG TPA: hypothetical protein VG056_01495 [Pirellulales bacterium]|jgi:hypothetical protein|nr:hypothetical protein [Pirellulales bacterium]